MGVEVHRDGYLRVSENFAECLYEGLDQPGLDPESLYEAQLLNRTQQRPAGFRTGCPLVP